MIGSSSPGGIASAAGAVASRARTAVLTVRYVLVTNCLQNGEVAWAATAIELEAGLGRACVNVGYVQRSRTMRRTLIVANRTASTPVLMQEVQRRAMEQATSFVLLIPYTQWKRSPDWTLEDALKALRRRRAGRPGCSRRGSRAVIGGEDPFESVKQLLELERFDDAIVSTLPKRSSEWLKRDLPSRIEALGLPVTTITPPGPDRRVFSGRSRRASTSGGY